ncbi:hypothetical protein [Xanthovirga aplysinae]|uniref:hypothetical protein n=1 Tax=Xanthovirga aplysinae TaxID=2529853 RepID=UPI0016575E00|nr:hypothetical protein [Xanthovirga aplysinae]MTI30093.1 hypothetical protein [Xanthovirga aplysinae]
MAHMMQAMLQKYNKGFESFHEELIFKFSLILLVLDGSTGWGLDVFMRIICALMLAFSHFGKNKILWLIISLGLLFFNSQQFYILDNHKILFVYWVLLITFYLWTDKELKYLRSNSKILIGLVMFFAVLQKVINEFTSPGFMHGRFLFDERFMLVTHFLIETPYEVLANNRNSIGVLNILPVDNSFVTLSSTPFMGRVLYAFQLFGLAFEGLVASLFLFSKNDSIIKDIVLLLFCLGTYFIFPVIGFSSILLILGIAQSSRKMRKFYILTFILLQFIIVPWQEIIFYIQNAI